MKKDPSFRRDYADAGRAAIPPLFPSSSPAQTLFRFILFFHIVLPSSSSYDGAQTYGMNR